MTAILDQIQVDDVTYDIVAAPSLDTDGKVCGFYNQMLEELPIVLEYVQVGEIVEFLGDATTIAIGSRRYIKNGHSVASSTYPDYPEHLLGNDGTNISFSVDGSEHLYLRIQ